MPRRAACVDPATGVDEAPAPSCVYGGMLARDWDITGGQPDGRLSR